MKQVLQSLRNGATTVDEVPSPGPISGHLIVATTRTLISSGTERMLVQFGRSNPLEKVRQQPDKVRMVLEKARTDGIAATIEAVQSKLDQPLALGYCNVGLVASVGEGLSGINPGDRVVSNGPHAEVVRVPKNLCALVPSNVSDDQAAFTVLGAIGLQAIRLVNPTLGEAIVVTGLGLIGLLTVQMLKAQGCRVLGVDPDPQRRALARDYGADVVDSSVGADVDASASVFSRGRGVDAVIITASTSSSEPVAQAARISRQRGRIVLAGVTGLELSRADFYKKELTFQVSCSYGPGRYDPGYEEKGHDYPFGLVRWTEQRNLEAVLDLMANGQIETSGLVSHRFDIDRAAEAYDVLASGHPSLGILLDYPSAHTEQILARSVVLKPSTPSPAKGITAFLGAGNYAGRVLIPAFREAGATLRIVVSAGGVSAAHAGRKFGFAGASTDPAQALDDPAVDTVVVATRHSEHAAQVLMALRAGKHVFCEKPLCLTHDELSAIANEARERPTQALMVGFNRRFSPLAVKARALLATVAEPKSIQITVNAGAIPLDHWTQDPTIGGGRIVGEACHFVDLLRYLVDAPITSHSAVSLGAQPGAPKATDKAVLTLEFDDGSVGTIHYLANGHKGFPKERVEVFCAGRVLQLDNFRRLRGWGWPRFESQRLWRQDKGQSACAASFVAAIREGTHTPVPLDEILEVSQVSIDLQRQVSAGRC